MSTIRTGTAHYANERAARDAYCWDFEGALAEGRIAIGRPVLKPGQRLLIDTNGRYHIEEELKNAAP